MYIYTFFLTGSSLPGDVSDCDSDTTETTVVPPWQPELSTSFDSARELYGTRSSHEVTSGVSDIKYLMTPLC